MESNTAINCCDEQKREAEEEEEEEEEEEALSLCDLPVNLIDEEENRLVQPEENGEPETISTKSEEDFNFGSWSDPLSIKPEMCTADELFFKGQILPLRLSVSSDTSRCFSRSESMDHGSLSRFTSVGSSSTISSHYTTSSSGNSKSAVKIRNNFNTHPSPKPQIRSTKTRTPNIGSRNQRTSSVWDFFRLGLVRAPELELQDLKLRSSGSNNKNNNDNKNSVSRNSSCNSSNSSSSTKVVNNGGGEAAKNQRDLSKGLLEKRMGLLFGGCKCSVNAVETVPSNNIVVAKSSSSNNNHNNKNNSSEKEKATSSHARSAIEEKKKKKQALSRHRTFEWIKELSHASYVDDA